VRQPTTKIPTTKQATKPPVSRIALFMKPPSQEQPVLVSLSWLSGFCFSSLFNRCWRSATLCACDYSLKQMALQRIRRFRMDCRQPALYRIIEGSPLNQEKWSGEWTTHGFNVVTPLLSRSGHASGFIHHTTETMLPSSGQPTS
jgi:hypothetical protein